MPNYPLAMLTTTGGSPGSPPQAVLLQKNVIAQSSASTSSSGSQNGISTSQARFNLEGNIPQILNNPPIPHAKDS
jgi:hypothetical protein